MKDFMHILVSYLKRNIKFIVIVLIAFVIFRTVFSLYSLPWEATGYAALLSGVFILIMGIAGFASFYRRHKILEKVRNSIAVSDVELPAPKDLLEKDYQELLKITDRKRMDTVNEKDTAYSDMMEYYTMWAHQIKTPIAAMRLLLQSEQPEYREPAGPLGRREQPKQPECWDRRDRQDWQGINGELLEQLFKVEQYVEMVMQYLRMEDMSGDLLVKRYSLDNIVKQAVRKYSKTFIRKKIRLSYKNLNRRVLTDEKWLVFVVEQIMSNALKYTKEGGTVSVYMDADLPDTLVIEDTGVGIEPADLPRIFERGYTGYNGRADKKSTGIGLYLCKSILNKLSHTIEIESEAGKGTKVRIGLDSADIGGD